MDMVTVTMHSDGEQNEARSLKAMTSGPKRLEKTSWMLSPNMEKCDGVQSVACALS